MTSAQAAAGVRAHGQRTALASALTLAVAAAVYLMVQLKALVMLVAAGVLLAVALRALGRPAGRFLALGNRAATATVMVALGMVLLGLASWLALMVVREGAQLSMQLPELARTFARAVEGVPAGRWLATELARHAEVLLSPSGLPSWLGGVFSATFGGLVDLLVVGVVAAYLAYDPHLYTDGLLSLVSPALRPRLACWMEQAAQEWQTWLQARVMFSLLVGVGVGLAMVTAKVPLAVLVGSMVALFAFLPVVGAILAPALGGLALIAAGPGAALAGAVFVASLYGAMAMAVRRWGPRGHMMPPGGLILIVQVVLAGILGFWGLVLAPLLLIALMVALAPKRRAEQPWQAPMAGAP